MDSYLRCCLEGGFNPRDAITHVVAWKGAILRRARGQRLAASDPAIADQFRQLQSVASQLSAATRSIPKPQQMEAWRNRLNALAEQQQKLESELVRRSDVFRQAVKKVSLDSVCQSIPEGGVLVDFLEYNGKDGRSLLASVIRHNGDPVLIELGSAAEAGEAIDAWRESYGMTSEAKAAGAKLREQLWEPLHEHVDDAELILVSTDGVLGRFPLAALPGSNADRFLIEEHRIASIPVPGLLPDLVADQDTEDAHAHDLLLMGNVDYGAPDSSGREPTTAPAIETLAATRAAHGLQWPQLAETGREIDAIKKLYQQAEPTRQNTIIDLQEASATESAFRNQAPKCKLIHLATHGFFAPADKKNALSPEAIAESQDMTRLGQQREGFVGFSPGQLSGLVFAGANRPPESLGSLRDGVQNDDGIMTADEIAYLPLNNVDLAVLSACETGLGEVAGGEGLIGIQRAFQVSGVDSVVATMWKVDDTMTRVLMERFYRNLFEKKMSKLDALREAQLSLLHGQGLDSTTLRGLGTKTVKVDVTVKPEPNQGQRLSPRYWAPFVLSGDWR